MTPRKTAAPRRRSNTGSKAVSFTPTGVTWQFGVPAGTKFNYAGEVGNGLGSSVLVALLCWLMRAFPEAPAVVEKRDAEQWKLQFGHAMSKLIAQPNPFYTGRELWMATVMDFAFGNAYWLKVRDGFDKVTELWWVPAALMRPVVNPQEPNTFIDHYEYRIDGQTHQVAPRDVVHFRFGLHPDNPRLGYTPLAALVREIYIDDQASNFTASVLRNLGIIGVVVAPKAGETIPQDKMRETKEYLQQNFSGDKRGQGLVFSKPTDVQVLQYNMQGFDVGPIRDIAEERCSAALGIPAAVVGFGTGLQQTKVGATMRELIQQAWNACIMPMQAILADKLDSSLLPEFQANTGHSGLFRAQFDTSNVRALREDEKEQAERLGKLAIQGIIMLSEARSELGFEVRPEHEVYYRPTTVVAVKKPLDIEPTQVREQVNDPVANNAGAPAPNDQQHGKANAAA